MPKIRWQYDAGFDGPTLEGSRVEVVTVGGARHGAECRIALGHPDNPMSQDQQLAKFLDCASAALEPLPRERAMRIVDAVMSLEKLADMRELAQLLA